MLGNSSPLLKEFEQNLNELTFSSLPIIENLTTIAREHPEVADGIIDLITKRISKCIPDHKLSALHLLDSICKHVSNPYNILVGDEIYDIYSQAFLLVTEPVRIKMYELFQTWKITKAKNSNFPLFPRDQLDKIDSFLSKAGYPKHIKGDQLTNKGLVDYIDSMIPLFKAKLDSSHSTKLQDQYNALLLLKGHLNSQSLKQAQLQAIHERLNAVREQELGSHPAIRSPPMTESGTIKSVLAAPLTTGLGDLTTKQGAQKAETIFRYLVSSGLVHVDQAPIPGSKPQYTCVFPSVKYAPTSVQSANAIVLQEMLASGKVSLEYEQLKLSESLLVSKQVSNGLQAFVTSLKPSQEALDLLYGAKGWKCGQCGKRFPTDSDGARRKRLHLDWHFRINKKLDDPTARVQSRGWYLDDYDWVAFRDENLLEFATSTTQGGTDPYGDSSIAEDTSSTSFVQVPASDTNMNNRCVICRELIKATYNDEIGEWCWYGSVLAPGEGPQSRKIVHSACLNEASNKRGPENDGLRALKREKTS